MFFRKAAALTALALLIPVVSPVAAIAQEAETKLPNGRFAAMFGASSAVPSLDGILSFGATYANPRGGIKGRDGDGDVSLSYSFGNATTPIAGTLSASVTGIEPFGDGGSFSLSLSRMVGVSPTALTFVGGSLSGLGHWGDGSDDLTASVYLSQIGDLGGTVPYVWSLGFAENSTRDPDTAELNDGLTWGVGLGLVRNASFSLSGTTTQMNAGVVVGLPFAPGVSVSAGVYDITDNVDRNQKAITIGYGFDTKGLF